MPRAGTKKAAPPPDIEPAKGEESQEQWPPADWIGERSTLGQRKRWVIASMRRIVRDQQVDRGTAGGTFKAVSHDAVVREVTPWITRAGIDMSLSAVSYEHEWRETVSYYKGNEQRKIAGYFIVKVEGTLRRSEDRTNDSEAEVIHLCGFGEGKDAGTFGYQGAVSRAKKSIIIAEFQIETGDEEDTKPQPEDVGTAEPQRKSTAKPPAPHPVDEPALSQDPHEAAFNIPERAWQYIAGQWHTKGVISEKQVKRVFAVAVGNGWKSDDVSGVIHHHLGVSVSQLPYQKPYDGVVRIFEKFKPSAGTGDTTTGPDNNVTKPGEEADQEQFELEPPSEDDIPF